MTLVQLASMNRSDIAAMMPMNIPPSVAPVRFPMPAHHSGRERQQAELEAELEERLPVVEGDDEAGRAGQCTGDEERQRDGPVHVDAHETRRLAILGRGAHRLALAGVGHEPAQGEQQRDRDAEHDQISSTPNQAAPLGKDTRSVRGRTGSTAFCDGSEQDEPDVLQHERHRRSR